MNEREQVEQAITALEAQRALLGDALVEAALAPLRQKLAALTQTPGALPLAGGGERRVVTLLFCDIQGSTSMAEQLDPEEWAGIMNRAFESLIAPVYRHGGIVARLMGDAILAFFGAPIAHEDDPRRAVLAGLEIIEGIRTFREQAQREHGLDFNVRVGINTGLVVVGEVGADQRVEYTAMGDAVNLAARMEQTARPGTVQITAHTYQLIAPEFECEPLGRIELKGRNDPVLAYRVIGKKVKTGQLRGLERQGLYAALVARQAEFGEVSRCVERLLAGQGGLVSLIGEAGLGKSRLIAEVRSRYRSPPRPTLYLEGQSLSFGQTISYWPFQEILRSWAGIAEEDDEVEAWRKLHRQVSALFAEQTIDILPYLARLLALEVRDEYAERVKYLDGEAMGTQIFLASRRFFEQLAHQQPVMLVFEDLHWMDESSIQLLEHLLPLIERVPLLMIGLTRPERDAPVARLRELALRNYAGRYTEIRLAPLSRAESGQLAYNLLEGEDLPPRVRELILGKAEGNPFYLEEIIRTLIDSGAVARDPASGRWRATTQTETLTLPDTLQGIILARVDRLEEEAKLLLRVASVIGRSFRYRVLQAMAQARQQLDDHLAQLQRIELIREKQRLPELEYIFKHALIQEATYESILLQQRRDLHVRVGQAIETVFADRLEEFYGLLAFHYARAQAWEKAQNYLLKAGDQAGRMAADAEALAHYQQAIVAYAHAFGDRWDPFQRATLERKMGEAFFRRGDYTQALEHLRLALTDLGHPLPASRWGIRRAILLEILQQIGRRLAPGLLLEPVTALTAPAAEEQLRVYLLIGRMAPPLNPELFLFMVLRALNFSERHSIPTGVTLATAGLGYVFDLLAIFSVAERLHRRSVKLAEQLQQPDVVSTAYELMTLHQLYLGHWGAVLALGQQAAAAHHTTGDLRDWGWVTTWMALASAHRGDLSQALALAESLLQVGRDGGDQQVRLLGILMQGYAELRLGRLPEATTHAQQAIELAESIPDYAGRVGAGVQLGQCYLRQGQLAAALDALEASRRISLAYHVREPINLAKLRNGLAEAHLSAAEQSENAERDDWLKQAGRACKVALAQANAVRGFRPEALRWQGRYEWLKGNASRAKQCWQRSLAEAEASQMQYELGLTHLELGQRLREPAHLEKAEAIFAAINAEFDLAGARESLSQLRTSAMI